MPLGEYVSKLQGLAGEMSTVESGPPNADTKKATAKFEDAVQTAEGLLLKMDDTGQLLMTDLLMNPLRQGYKAVVRNAGGAASGLWEVMVYPTYRDKIKDRYPFNLASTRDASFEDATAFFKPKDGVLWGFYDTYLKSYHTKQNHDFIPESHLEASPRPAKPYTPFNANLYNCLKRADEITDSLFAGETNQGRVPGQREDGEPDRERDHLRARRAEAPLPERERVLAPVRLARPEARRGRQHPPPRRRRPRRADQPRRAVGPLPAHGSGHRHGRERQRRRLQRDLGNDGPAGEA